MLASRDRSTWYRHSYYNLPMATTPISHSSLLVAKYPTDSKMASFKMARSRASVVEPFPHAMTEWRDNPLFLGGFASCQCLPTSVVRHGRDRHQTQHREVEVRVRRGGQGRRHHTMTDDVSNELKRQVLAAKAANTSDEKREDNDQNGSLSGDSGIQSGSNGLSSTGGLSKSSPSLKRLSTRPLPAPPSSGPSSSPLSSTTSSSKKKESDKQNKSAGNRLMFALLKHVRRRNGVSGSESRCSRSKSRCSESSTSSGASSPAFGRNLDSVLSSRTQSCLHEVPRVLESCTRFVETHGITDGVYRVSGKTSNIRRLKCLFDTGDAPQDLSRLPWVSQDVHCVSALVKQFFRELPEDLFTEAALLAMAEAARTSEVNSDSRRTLAIYMSAMGHLRRPQYRTLRFLLLHLKRVSEMAEVTGMTAKNLAIVWAPTLLRRVTDSGVDTLANTLTHVQQRHLQLSLVRSAKIVQHLIDNATWVFDDQNNNDHNNNEYDNSDKYDDQGNWCARNRHWAKPRTDLAHRQRDPKVHLHDSRTSLMPPRYCSNCNADLDPDADQKDPLSFRRSALRSRSVGVRKAPRPHSISALNNDSLAHLTST